MNLYYSNLFGIGWDILASAFNSARVTMAGKGMDIMLNLVDHDKT